MKISIAIVIGAIILGGFYSYTQHEKLASVERQAEMKIEQENNLRQLEQEKNDKDSDALKEKQETDAKIRTKCSAYLQRNGNYLVTNETLNTNYNACLHANGL